MPGPGARDGIRKCFGRAADGIESDVIRYMADYQEEHFARLGLQFNGLRGRSLQLIDCQNLFCEVDKYARVAHPDIQRNQRAHTDQAVVPPRRGADPGMVPAQVGNQRRYIEALTALLACRDSNARYPGATPSPEPVDVLRTGQRARWPALWRFGRRAVVT